MDKRREERVALERKVRFQGGDLESATERESKNLSAGGVFIRTPRPLEVGTEIRFELDLGADGVVPGLGKVVWTRRPDPRRRELSPGMGIAFVVISADDRSKIEVHLRARAQPTAAPAPSAEVPAPRPAAAVAKRTLLGMPTPAPPQRSDDVRPATRTAPGLRSAPLPRQGPDDELFPVPRIARPIEPIPDERATTPRASAAPRSSAAPKAATDRPAARSSRASLIIGIALAIAALLVIAIVVVSNRPDPERPARAPVVRPEPVAPSRPAPTPPAPTPHAPTPHAPTPPAPTPHAATPPAATPPAVASPAPTETVRPPAPTTPAAAPAPSKLAPGQDPLVVAHRLIIAGDAAQAMPILQAALNERAPPMVYSLLGQAHEKLGNRPAAIAAYVRFIELRPDLPEAARLRRRIVFLGSAPPP